MRRLGQVLLAAAILSSSTAVAPAFAEPVSTTQSTTIHAVPGFGHLTDLVVRRINLGDAVAASKYFSGKPVDDPVREQQIIDAVRAAAGDLRIDPEETADFFRAQIEASKVVQRGLLRKWAQDPSTAPTTGPDLDAVRKELDQLTTGLLQELATINELRHDSPRCEISLLLATIPAGLRLDRLHREALATATGTACET